MRKAIEVVKAARSVDKISGHQIRTRLFADFFELHGDGLTGDDSAIVGGLATFNSQPVTVITTSRGHSMEERLAKHFGQPSPSGYHKIVRLVKQAEKFKRPVLLFVDTAGAYPGLSAEESGQGQAIARDLLEVGNAKVPIISVIYGEGGSGGALAMACGDAVYMLDNAIYSILSPEGFAAIAFKDASKSEQAADLMGLTPEDLLANDVIEGIIATGSSYQATVNNIKQVIDRELTRLTSLSTDELMRARYQRFRKF